MTKNNIDINQLVELAAKHQAQQSMQSNQASRGISYCELLSIVLITLKCLNLIACSWVVPFLPLAVPFVLYGIVLLVGFIKSKFFSK